MLVFLFLTMLINTYLFIYRQDAANQAKGDNNFSSDGFCESLRDENECFKNEACEGIYNASSDELIFLYCQTQSEETRNERQAQKDLCQKSGGEYYINKLGGFCLCQSAGPDKKFDKIKGCISKIAE